MTVKKNVLFLSIFPLIVVGCIYSRSTPEESFVNHYRWYVGKTIGYFKRSANHSDGIRMLPNGNIEEWWGKSPSVCILVYEYRSSDGVIVAWRTEGDQKKCIQSPYT
jgi:hypothetical protein